MTQVGENKSYDREHDAPVPYGAKNFEVAAYCAWFASFETGEQRMASGRRRGRATRDAAFFGEKKGIFTDAGFLGRGLGGKVAPVSQFERPPRRPAGRRRRHHNGSPRRGRLGRRLRGRRVSWFELGRRGSRCVLIGRGCAADARACRISRLGPRSSDMSASAT